MNPDRRVSSLALVALTAALGGGCNALTGVDGLTLDDDGGPRSGFGDGDAGGPSDDDGDGDEVGSGSGGSSVAGSGTSGPSNGSGSGNAPGSVSGSGAGDSSSGAGATEDLADVDGVGIAEVAFYQGVEAKIVSGGQARSPAVPIVAGRDALVRVFPSIAGYDGQPVWARLLLEGQAPIEQEVTLQSPSQENLGSTVNFEVPAAMIAPGASFRVEIKRPGAPGASTGSSYPVDGSFAPTQAEATGRLKITIVPVQYGADGSNRMPDVSPAQVDAYRALFGATYPSSELDLSVGSSVTWNGAVSANGSGWDSLLNAIAEHRSDDGADFDEYYFGIFNPAGSFQGYCSGGCVAGLGFLGGAGDDYVRSSIGLGFGGELSTGTAIHEVGHNHGRDHAPCGTSGDGAFPHPGAKIGEWGYDRSAGQLKDPNTFVDFMSYCDPTWVSDYTYSALLDRIQALSGMDMYVPEESRHLDYERVSVGVDGAQWLTPVTIERPPVGTFRTLHVTTVAGQTRDVDAAFFPYDHLEGGLYVFPAGSVDVRAVELESAGRRLTISR